MGRDKVIVKSLYDQAYDRLKAMRAFGQSKRRDKKNGETIDKIYSIETFKTYWKHIKYFIRYVKKHHPECVNIKEAKQYVNEFLEFRESQNLSAWTIQTEAKALGKLYGIRKDSDEYFVSPIRRRADIKRSRKQTSTDKWFVKTNEELDKEVLPNIGFRRRELLNTKGRDLYTKRSLELQISELENKDNLTENDELRLRALRATRFFDNNYYVKIVGKGKKLRYAPIFDDNEFVVNKYKNARFDEKLYPKVSSGDVHSYRTVYAHKLYEKYKNVECDKKLVENKKGTAKKEYDDRYICRKDKAGKVYSKYGLIRVTKALGHNRLSVAVDHYF